jgi:hypothetical protein
MVRVVSSKRKRKDEKGRDPSSCPKKRREVSQTPIGSFDRPPVSTPLGQVLHGLESYQNGCQEEWESCISEQWSDQDETAYWKAAEEYAYKHAKASRKGALVSVNILILQDWGDADEKGFLAAAKRNGYKTTQKPVETPLKTSSLHSIVVLISGDKSDGDDAFFDKSWQVGINKAQQQETLPLEKGFLCCITVSDASLSESCIFGRPSRLGGFL